MPYILNERRKALWSESETDLDSSIKNAGELNYILTSIILGYLKDHGKSYQTFNDISGAMTECLAEFRRRVISPYEDKKIQENGDIYE